MSTRHIDIRVFAEGVRIPAAAVSRSQARMGSMRFTVTIPPTPIGFSVLPGTLMHVFVRRAEPTTSGEIQERFVLFAEGRVRGRSWSMDRSGNRMLVLECQGLDAEWQYLPIGFDVGMDTTFPRPRLKALFNGLSPSLYEKSYLPRLTQVMGYQVWRILSGGRDMSTDPFFDLKSVLYNMMGTEGPALGMAQMIAMLPRVHPLERQSMQATRFYKRLVAVENIGFTKHLKGPGSQENFEKLKGRIDSMSPQHTTLRQVLDLVLPTTYHHQFSIASPYFNAELYATRGDAAPEIPVEDKEEVPTYYEVPRPSSEPADSRKLLIGRAPIWPSSIYSMSDFDCRRPGQSGYAPVPEEYKDNVRRLAANLQIISSWLGGVKLTINSAYRTEAVNAEVKGEDNSFHLYGMAADIRPPAGMNTAQLWMLLDHLIANGKITRGGLGYYDTFVHYDVRGSRAFWSKPGPFDRAKIERAALGRTEFIEDGYTPSPNVSLSTQELENEWKASSQAGVLPSFVIKPNLHMSPPPSSNVFFGNLVSNVQAVEGFDNSPTRMMMLAPSVMQQLIEPSNPLSSMFTPMYFMPNHVQGVIDNLTSEPRYSDIRLKDYDPNLDIDKVAGETRSNLREDVDLSEIDSDLQKPLLASATITADQKVNGEKDVLAKLINEGGPLGLSDRLMGIYTFEELFKGVRQTSSRLPYMQKSTDPEQWVAIYGHYAFATMSRQARIVQMNMPLNLNVAVGFSAAFYDHSTGWIVGEVETVVDTVDASGQAFTSVQLGGCAFYSDLDNPYWARIYEDNQGSFDNYSRPGAQTPSMFDAAFAPGEVGRSIYKAVLGVGSVIDLAQSLSGTENMTLRDALEYLRQRYIEAENPMMWAEAQFRRPIVTEGEFMQLVLEAAPEAESNKPVAEQLHERYGATYPVHEWPNLAQFAEERRLWAEDYRRDLEVRDHALDVINPSMENYAVKEVALPNEEAQKQYQKHASGRKNTEPKINFLNP